MAHFLVKNFDLILLPTFETLCWIGEAMNIYIITLFKIESGIVRHERTLGWLENFEEAEECVLSNYGDMYEYGEYNVALIEKMPSGLYMKPREEFWYAVDKYGEQYNPITQGFDIPEYKVERCEKPGIFEKLGGFSMS